MTFHIYTFATFLYKNAHIVYNYTLTHVLSHTYVYILVCKYKNAYIFINTEINSYPLKYTNLHTHSNLNINYVN